MEFMKVAAPQEPQPAPARRQQWTEAEAKALGGDSPSQTPSKALLAEMAVLHDQGASAAYRKAVRDATRQLSIPAAKRAEALAKVIAAESVAAQEPKKEPPQPKKVVQPKKAAQSGTQGQRKIQLRLSLNLRKSLLLRW